MAISKELHKEQKKMIKEYYNGVEKEDLIKNYKITLKQFNYINEQYVLDLNFDEKSFFDKLKSDYNKMRQNDFINKYGGNYGSYPSLRTKMRVYPRRLIHMIRQAGVEVDFTVKKVEAGRKGTLFISVNGFYEEPIVRKPNPYKMASAELEDYKEKLAIIESQRARLDDLLHEKGMSAELKTRIINLANVIARESMLVGIQSAKNGYGDKLEFNIMKSLGMV